jgi:hypothetical protein
MERMSGVLRGSLLRAARALLVAGGLLLPSSQALATPQFEPTLTALFHTVTSGETGATYNTGGLAANGQVEFTNSTSSLHVDAELDVLHYYDPANGSCPTDSGSDCQFDFGVDDAGASGLNLDISVDAVLAATPFAVTDLGGGFFQVDVNFETTGGIDILFTDPTDGDSTQLAGSWVAGSFDGNPFQTGLVSTVFYDVNANGGSGGVIGNPTILGFADITGGPLASMFDDGGGGGPIMLNLTEVFDFSPDLDSLTADIINTGQLNDFTAELEGQIFRVSTGDFVIPEPATALLLGFGLAGIGVVGRRNA